MKIFLGGRKNLTKILRATMIKRERKKERKKGGKNLVALLQIYSCALLLMLFWNLHGEGEESIWLLGFIFVLFIYLFYLFWVCIVL